VSEVGPMLRTASVPTEMLKDCGHSHLMSEQGRGCAFGGDDERLGNAVAGAEVGEGAVGLGSVSVYLRLNLGDGA